MSPTAADDFHVNWGTGTPVPSAVDLCLSDAGQREWQRCNGQRQILATTQANTEQRTANTINGMAQVTKLVTNGGVL